MPPRTVTRARTRSATSPRRSVGSTCPISRRSGWATWSRSRAGHLGARHRVGRVIARPFVGEPGNYVRTPNRHDFSLEPRRPNYLTLVREAGKTVYGVGKIGDIFAGRDIDDSRPTKSNVEGIQQTETLLREIDDGLVFTNLVETDMLWGHRNDPVNFHRCLQDLDRKSTRLNSSH